MKRLAIVGGGISGLAVAVAASEGADKVPDGLEILVLEKEAEVGGKAVSLAEDGWLVETGPTGYLDNDATVDRLVEAASITKVPANAAAARRFLVLGGELREIAPNPVKFARAGILSPPALVRILGEPFIKARADGVDESVFDFAARRVGREFAERVISPMVLGVFAGEARKISLPAAFPLLDTLEREHGSLFRGMVARARTRKREARAASASGADPGAAGGPAGPAGTLTSFEGGLQALPRALAARGGFEVRCGLEVEAVKRDTSGWVLRLADGEGLTADAVALCGEPWAMAPLLEGAAPAIATELQALYCPPVIVIALGFGPASLAKVPRGFGALIPRSEGFRMLGCLWDTHLFPARSPEGHLLIRVMLGGAVDPAVISESDDALVEIVRQELGRLSGLSEEPLYRRVVRWPRAIPQYELGHLDRVARVEAALAEHPGLFLAGNSLHGISFTKSASYGLEVGERAVAWIAGQRSRVI